MYRLKERDVCPGFKHFGLKVEVLKDANTRDNLRSVFYNIVISPKLCDLCQCADTRKVERGKFSVKCAFDEFMKEVGKNEEVLKRELEIWRLRVGVLQKDVHESVVKAINEKRARELGDEPID